MRKLLHKKRPNRVKWKKLKFIDKSYLVYFFLFEKNIFNNNLKRKLPDSTFISHEKLLCCILLVTFRISHGVIFYKYF